MALAELWLGGAQGLVNRCKEGVVSHFTGAGAVDSCWQGKLLQDGAQGGTR